MKRTSKGRVVYDRPTHYFRPSDVTRVLLRVNWALYKPEENLQEIIKILEIISRKFVEAIKEPFTSLTWLAEQKDKFIAIFLEPLRALTELLGTTIRKWLGWE